jgi:TctA family transporter
LDTLQLLFGGFLICLTPANLLFAFIGCVLGTVIGVLPGIGPAAGTALLIPVTTGMDATGSIIMLAAIYYGAMYGGTITSVLMRTPGEAASVVTCIDGYEMAKQGRAGVALSTAAIGSFFAGCVATLALAALAGPLTAAALLFGPKEFFALMILGLILASVLSSGPFIEGIGMVALGMLLSLVGTDLSTGTQRFAFGIPQLFDGLDFVPLAMGIFGFAEIVKNLEQDDKLSLVTQKIANLFPTREDFRRMIPAILRGTALGTLLGVLPGGGAVLSSFASYTLEKKLSKYPEQFGKGAIEGVAGPESANNAGAQTSFIPLLTLGVPSNVVMALMVGAMNIHNIQPGPQVMTKNPTLFWGLIASMWVGNLMLLILNLPLVGLWVKLLTIPYRYLFPAIMVFCSIGVYSINSGTFEVYEAAVFCAFGYLLIKLQLPAAPLLLGLVLGPAIEENFRRAMVLSRGDATVFLTSPLSAALLAAAAIAVVLIMLPTIRTRREEALQE